ncbi:MAG: V-type ATP synthase subunit K, partial [archaeon]
MVSEGAVLAALGAAIAVGGAGLASGMGAGISGAAGASVVADDPKKFGLAIIFQAIPQTQGFYGFLIGILILFGTGILGGAGVEVPIAVGLACVGAGLAVGISGFSAIGQGIVSGAAVSEAARRPGMFGKGMVFSVLPETQAIYGLLISILILFFTGVIGGAGMPDIPLAAGFAAIGAGLAVGLAGLSAIGQGIAAAAGVGATAEKPEAFGKSMVFSVLPETQAIYGLLISILILFFTGIIGGNYLPQMELPIGIAAIGAGMAVGFAGLSAIGQGIAAAAGAAATADKPHMFGKSMVFSVL